MGKTFLHFVRYFLGLDLANTQTTEAERAALSRHAAGKHRLGEIGVFEGRSTAVLARAMAPDGVLYAIDPFSPGSGRFGISWARPIARREVGRIEPPRRVIFVEKLSHEAAAVVKGDLDFLFVDGDHSWEGIQLDWNDWSKRITPGGIVALHDTHPAPHRPDSAEWESVRFFEDQIRRDPRFEVLEQLDLLSILRRHVESAVKK